MTAKTKTATLLALCLLAVPAVKASSLTDQAGDWLKETLSFSDDLKVSFSKNKIAFKGCRQRDYQFSVAQAFGPAVAVEAVLHYEKGSLHNGLLAQRVKSQAYEVVSWFNQPNYRVGFGSRVRNEHEIALPMAQLLRLPTSQALKLQIEFAGVQEDHKVALSAVRETWQADKADLQLPWRRSHDNQLHLNYQIAF